MGRGRVLLVTMVLLGAACTQGAEIPDPTPAVTIGPGKVSGPLDERLRENLEALVAEPVFLTQGSIAAVGESGDLRAAWPLVDFVRFHEGQVSGPELIDALATLTGVRVPDEEVAWVKYTDLLLQNEIPAPPRYLDYKRPIYVAVGSGWEPFFTDKADLDWREVSWGGVRRDAIDALTDPPLTDTAGGAWLPDDDVVFGVTIGDDAVAYPKRVMEVHELVNDTVGGRAGSPSPTARCAGPLSRSSRTGSTPQTSRSSFARRDS